MGYLQEVDRWLDELLVEVSEERLEVAELKRAIREKILESYRNGQQAGGQSPASEKPTKSRSQNKPEPHTEGQKPQRYTGDWQCAKCGTAITSLPFKPRGTSADRLQCIECYKKTKEAEE